VTTDAATGTPPAGSVLVHHHLFKNAGTTIDWILRRACGPGYLGLEEALAAGLTTAEALLDYVLAHPDIWAVTRHHLPFAPMEYPGRAFLDILLVRHPIDRLRSIYDFLRADPADHDELSPAARRLGLADFCRLLLDRHPNYVNDAQVTTIANAGGYVRPPDDADARIASDLVRRAVITGPVERFDECLVAAEHFLRPLYGPLDLAYVAQNVAATRRPTLDARLDAFRRECGRSLYAHLLRANELDFELVRAAEAEVDRRVRLIPGYGGRLAEYRERCRRLQVATTEQDSERSRGQADQPPHARLWAAIQSQTSGRASVPRRRFPQRS
jgi:hypothetical protein